MLSLIFVVELTVGIVAFTHRGEVRIAVHAYVTDVLVMCGN